VGTMTIAWPGTSIEWRNDQVIDSGHIPYLTH
jgi:hypothetical protein